MSKLPTPDRNPLQWVQPHILALKPYSSARDEFSGAAEVYLDANENAFGPTVQGNDNQSLHRYPDPHAADIKVEVSKLVGVPTNQIFIGNGSDEAIDLLLRVFCQPAIQKVIIMPPTYGMYRVSAEVNNIAVLEVPLTADFQIDQPALGVCMASEPDARIMFICSPNNPTGNLINQDDIVYCCGHFNGIVVVDEAYIDFTTSQDATKWLAQYPNLVVIRTLSKAWGLASLRIGMAFGHPALIDILNRVKPPYNLSGPNQEIALRALQQGYGQQQHLVSQILEQRIWLTDQLNNLPIIEHLYRSDANFILVKFGPSIVAKAVYQYLLGVGIVVRDRSSQAGCANCLRVTVGTADENQKLILALCVYN